MWTVFTLVVLLGAAGAAVVEINDHNDVKDGVVKASLTMNSCDQAKCNQICQILGFKRGTCIGTSCECTRNEEKVADSLEQCNLIQCEQICRRLGFPGGACVGDKCKCDIILEIQALVDSNFQNSHSLGDCQPLSCDQTCRRIGYHGGACVNGRCKCDILKKFQNLLASTNHHSTSAVGFDCTQSRCYSLCHRLHYDNGICVGDRCKCTSMFPIEGAPRPVPLDDICQPRQCKKFCSSVGFSSGGCDGERCKCEILLHKDDNEIPPIQ